VVAQRIRIIAGEFGGRLLEVPEQGTRPLADRVRQALFAILEPRLPDTRVLDLCAGSGAAGLEALSRGAQHVQFVEMSRRATEVIRRNVRTLGLDAQVEIQTADALTALRAHAAHLAPADLIIADPPYDDLAVRNEILELVAANPSPLATNGLLVLSGRRVKGSAAQRAPRGLRLVRALAFGETAIELYERVAAEELR
jgi:16S rRNA (guanine966-N2)-methyltransferase